MDDRVFSVKHLEGPTGIRAVVAFFHAHGLRVIEGGDGTDRKVFDEGNPDRESEVSADLSRPFLVIEQESIMGTEAADWIRDQLGEAGIKVVPDRETCSREQEADRATVAIVLTYDPSHGKPTVFVHGWPLVDFFGEQEGSA